MSLWLVYFNDLINDLIINFNLFFSSKWQDASVFSGTREQNWKVSTIRSIYRVNLLFPLFQTELGLALRMFI